MAIDRSELYVGGFAYMKTRFAYSRDGAAQTFKNVHVEVLEVLGTRGARVRRCDNGKLLSLGRGDMEPDEDWLEERDRAHFAKEERLRQERLALAAATGIRDPLESEPPKPSLTAQLGDFMKQRGNALPQPSDGALAGDSAKDVANSVAQGMRADTQNDIGRAEQEARELAELQRELDALEAEEAAAKLPPAQPAPEGFPAILKALRTRHGVSMGELNRRLGCASPSQVSLWESGTFYPRNKSLEKLAAFFGVGVDVLEGFAPIPQWLPAIPDREKLRLVAPVQARNVSEPAPVAKRPLALPNPSPPQLSLSAKYQEMGGGWSEPKLPTADERRAREPEPQVAHIESRPEPTPPAAIFKQDAANAIELESVGLPLPAPNFDMWAEMGRRMREPLRAEMATLEAALTPLDDQIQALMQRKTDLAAKRVDVQEQLAAIDTMLSRRGKA